jgi:hypothetical protein
MMAMALGETYRNNRGEVSLGAILNCDYSKQKKTQYISHSQFLLRLFLTPDMITFVNTIQGFTRLSITNKTIDRFNIYISVDHTIIRSYSRLVSN